jgi:iron complex outermembrane recepter protein
MKLIKLTGLFCFAAALVTAGTPEKASLKGRITDKATQEPLAGATVFIPDLRIGAISDSNGEYRISNLPGQKFLIHVKMIGYASLTESVDLGRVSEKNFEMEAAVIEGKEIVITGSAVSTDNRRSSISVLSMNKEQLISHTSTNIIDAMAHQPGISQITTGGAISKPVIRGLGYNRIVTLHNGVKQEGQQWGDEHGIEIDENNAETVEILRGPASLLYGSDAMGGVINFLEPHPPSENTFGGDITSKYLTNESLFGNSVFIQGNRNGYSARFRASHKSASSYSTPDEAVYNSGFNELSFSGMVGVNQSWGFSHLHLSRFDSNIGLVEGERDSISGRFVDTDGNPVPEKDLSSRKLALPRQHILHNKASLVNRFILGKSQLSINLGVQSNDRKEFAESNEITELFFHLNTYSFDSKFYLPEWKNWETVIGFSSMLQENSNFGIEYLIPDYRLYDAGTFLFFKKSMERMTLNFGIRYDRRRVIAEQLIEATDTVFRAFDLSFTAFTGSVGLTYELGQYVNLKGNIGRGFRAPNLPELSANGIHEGTFRYEIGNTALKPETSLQLDGGISARTNRVDAELSIYYNRIGNYIYYRNTGNEQHMQDSMLYPVFRYTQGDAALKGFEFSMDVHILGNLHFENTLSAVTGTNLDTGMPLPFIPPFSIHNEIKYELEKLRHRLLGSVYFLAGMDNHLAQKRLDVFETPTAGYTLLNAGAGATVKLGGQEATFIVNVNNLLNTRYYDHLNRLKYLGILNRGRNISFTLNIPFGRR